ncbi:Major facilitator superfamily general substrate transporter [Cordyceps militaris]|uniref:Major facilitator superfamily general substrate transporter n=1 Tax=Cordyceps militaris TaxID=73501 RepID=A0A2H4SUX6_CORMI|nr:Major facilitator superfamily general substrate transporter [Cordyceps militaris]
MTSNMDTMSKVQSIRVGNTDESVTETGAEKVINPLKLSWPRKLHIIIAGFACTFNCNLGSSIPSGALDAISAHFGVASRAQLTLLNSLYMVGYVFGPLSEYVGAAGRC